MGTPFSFCLPFPSQRVLARQNRSHTREEKLQALSASSFLKTVLDDNFYCSRLVFKEQGPYSGIEDKIPCVHRKLQKIVARVTVLACNASAWEVETRLLLGLTSEPV